MNNIVRMQGSPQVGARDGSWTWNGTNWVCDPDCSGGGLPWQPPPPWFPPPATSPPWYPGGNAGVSFSPPGNPPPNPIRGNFWWDGSTLWMFDGAAWVPTGGEAGGSVTPPSSTAPANPQPGQQWFNGTTLFVWDGNAWVPVSQTKTYVQATAPPSPNPGDMWYNGTQLYVWSGTAWAIVGPGATVGPVPTTTQTFSLASNQVNLGGTAFTIVPFTATPSVDTQSAWDSVTKKLTPNKAGFYMFFGNAYLGGANTFSEMVLVKNDSGAFNVQAQYNVFQAGQYVAGASDWYSGSGIVHMNGTTDFVRLWANTGDGNFYIYNYNPVLQGFLLP